LTGEKQRRGGVDLKRFVDSLPSPAFVLTEQGQVVHANPRARASYEVFPSWLEELTLDGSETASCERAVLSPVELGEKRLWVVLPRERPARVAASAAPALGSPPESSAHVLKELSPTLREIARLVAAGLSDREIAAETGRPYSTVRTYGLVQK
jgi:hypothetical protein